MMGEQNLNKLINDVIYKNKGIHNDDSSLNGIGLSKKYMDDIIEPKQMQSFIDYLNIFQRKQDKKNQNSKNPQESDVQNVLSNIINDLNKTNITNNNIKLYDEIDSLIGKIPYAKRARDVLIDNIQNPNYFTNNNDDSIINVTITDKNNIGVTDVEGFKDKLQNYVSHFKIDEILEEILYDTITYGKFYIEIVNADEDLKNKGLLSENSALNEISQLKFTDTSVFLEFEDFDKYKSISDIITETDFTSNDKSKNKKDKKRKNVNKINNFYLRKHSPHKILKLGDDNITYGYIEITNTKDTNGIHSDSIINFNMPMQPKDKKTDNQNAQTEKITKIMLNKIFNMVDKKENLDIEDELKVMISKITKDLKKGDGTLNKNSKLKIRYIKPNNINEFYLNSKKESIFKDVLFTARLVIYYQIATVISKLSDSVDKQNVYFDVGITRDAQRIVQTIKEQMNKKKISIGEGDIDTIPTQLSTYQTTYIPQKNGKRFVEIEHAQGSQRSASDVENLKYFRDLFVAHFNIPPIYLSIEENSGSWTDTLSHQNIIFQRSISKYQFKIQKQLDDLLKNIYIHISDYSDTEIDYQLLNTCMIKLNQPTILKFEFLSNHINTAVNIVDSLTRLFGDSTKTYWQKKYLSEIIDFDDLELQQILSTIDHKIKGDTQEQQGGDSYGGY